MQAIVLHPANVTADIIRGNLTAITAAYRSNAMTTHGIIGTEAITEVNEFLEWCFDYTNCSDIYREQHKTRGMSVGDMLILVNVGGAYACMPSGWERIE